MRTPTLFPCLLVLLISFSAFAQPTTSSNWAWMKGDTIYPLWGKYETKGIASPTALPGTRSSSATWKDASGNLWLFGGEGSAASGIKGALNDLWKYNPVTNQWTWVKGDSSLNVAGVYGTKGVSNAANNPGGRHNAASWVDNSGKFWLFGGLNSSYVSHNDLWKYDPVTNEWTWVKGSNVTGSMGSYGTMGVSSATNEPSSRQAAAIWKEADGSLWMFGGSTGISSNAYDDLWKFDPLTEQWTWISGNIGSKAGVYGSLGVMAAGNKPGGRQGAVTWTDNSGNIWMMGGYGYGRVTTPFGVLNDLWKLDVVTRQWTWVKGDSIANAFAEYGSLNVSSATNKPGGRYGAVAWKDASGRLLLCNGYGNSEWKMGQHLGDVWRYDIGANHWTWIKGDSIGRRGGIYGDTGVFAAPNYPGGRSFAVAWPAANGNCWIYGGNGSTSDQHGKLNDTWQYNAATNQFAWYHGITRKMHDGVYGTKGVAGALNNPGGRSVAMTWTDSQGDLWMFGGLGNFNNHLWWCINDLWKFSRVTQEWTWVGGDNTANSPGTYGTQGVASVNNIPPARTGGVTWKDAAGNFWLFGGVSLQQLEPNKYYNDLWKYNPSTNQWTWVKGDNTPGQAGVYGTMGVAAAANKPGARAYGSSWSDGTGNLWMFGGSAGSSYNDLWKYNPVSNQWTWVKGSNTTNQLAVTGTQGVASASNTPGALAWTSAWKDLAGNFWLFGGSGYSSAGSASRNGDLWKYSPVTNQWTWMKDNQSYGVYGTQGVAAATNKPGMRHSAVSFTDYLGNFWLFGGSGYATTGPQKILDDLWKYSPTTNQWTWMKGSNAGDIEGTYGDITIPSASNAVPSKQSAVGWIDPEQNLWVFGGYTVSLMKNDLWKLFACAPAVTPAVTITASALDICPGHSVTFTALTTNPGFSPAFQWKKNGVNVGIGMPTYSTNSLVNGDVITCVLTSDAFCSTTYTSVSNSIVMKVQSFPGSVVYVNDNATGNNDGSSWANAFTDLQVGMDKAAACGITQVWVAAGTYKPNRFSLGCLDCAGSRQYSFSLRDNVAVYGGFNGTETVLSQRNWNTNTSILSGDLGVQGDTADNAYNVVTSFYNPATTILDGFIVEGGYANSNTYDQILGTAILDRFRGGGITLSDSYAKLQNCRFRSNFAWHGGAAYLYYSSATFTNCEFISDSALWGGGAIFMTHSGAEVEKCVFKDNHAGSFGGAIWNECLPIPPLNINNSVFTGNIAGSLGGGALSIRGTGINTITNTTFYNNASSLGSILRTEGPVTFKNSILWGSANPISINTGIVTATYCNIQGGYTGTGNINTNPLFSNAGDPDGPDNAWRTADDGLLQGCASPVVNTGTGTGAPPFDIRGIPRPPTAVDMGAYEVVYNVPSVAIAANTSNVICSGTSVTFTATPVNGGGSPSYQWKKNGINAGVNSNTYTTNSLANGDQVSCVLTSSAGCVNPATATSNTITFTVQSQVTPSVSIAASSATICQGTMVNFTASAMNGGASPVYQWKLNGNNVGTNSNAYSTNTLVTGDQVSCQLTSNAGCASNTTANSNVITITVTQPVTPALMINASSTNICAGNTVTFTANPTNGGTVPAYQWKVNGVNAGFNSAFFSTMTLADGDQVSCVVTSNAVCVTTSTATSNVITMATSAAVTPSVTINVPATSACAGSMVTFTASPSNGGTAPVYQWKLNGSNTGTNTSTYSTSTLNDGDQVSCVLTSNAGCITTPTATSNIITMTVSPGLTPGVSISTPSNPVCAGANATFTATPTHGGSTPFFQWKVNGVNVGLNSGTYSTSSLSNGDQVVCELTSSESCVTMPSAVSNMITLGVNALVTPGINISTPSTSICAGSMSSFTAVASNGGSTPAYQWKVNGVNAGTNSDTYNGWLNNGDQVSCELTSNAGCVTSPTAASNIITITTVTQVTPTITITASATNICAGMLVNFSAVPVQGGTSPVFQWKVNGAAVGTNSGNYSSNSLANGDVVTCELTSSESCVSAANATSNSIMITVNALVTPAVSITASATTICQGSAIIFTATSVNGGSTPSYQWKLNSVNVGTNSNTYSTTGLTNGDQVTCEITSNAGCVTSPVVVSNTVAVTVNPLLTPSVDITASATAICAGSSVTFTASPLNGGAAPAYQWKLNGVNVGANSNTYSTTGLTNGDQVMCELTSNEPCLTVATAMSNSISVTVTTQVTPSVNIAASAMVVCAGTNVTFTATVLNGGTSPAYQWKLNGMNVGINSSTYSNTSLNDADQVVCELTSNAGCATTNTVVSNTINMTVNPMLTPSVTITASSTTICAGTVVIFTAAPVNGGSNPGYQWKVNGVNVGTNSSTYSTTPVNGDQLSCEMTSNAGCVVNATATSNMVTVTVNPLLTPAVSISATSTTICAGTMVNFVATVTNGGAGPAYQWKINGANTGGNSNTYSTNGLNQGDVVSCEIVSNANCLATATATSNSIPMSVTPLVTPAITINASTNNICAGASVVFTANISNGGPAPIYQWRKNGTNVGTNSNTFSTSSLANGDLINCVLASNANCATITSVTSNNVAMTVAPMVTPAITINASSVNICAGAAVTFTAGITHGGTVPVYQWKLNGANAGTNSNTFSSSGLNNSDVITCVLTSNANCATTVTAYSNGITMVVNPLVTPTISISASSPSICAGGVMSFTASTTNAGINPIYQWQVNGVNTGGNARTFISTTLSDGDTVRCRLTSNANCLATPDAISTGLRAKVYPIPQINAGADDTVLTGGQVRLQPSSPDAGLNYRWSPATYLSSDTGASPLCKPTQDIQYTLTVTNEGGCTASDKVAVKVRTILVPSAFSPNGDGINDTWRIQALYSYPGATVEIFDRRGRLLFRSVNNKEWDGMMQGNPLPAGTYYYVIDTKLKGQQQVTGWVQLVK